MNHPHPACDKCKPYFDALMAEIDTLKKRLAIYENAHTPPSRQRFPERKKPENQKKIGRPEGHPGSTRPVACPGKTVRLTAKKCPFCKSKDLKLVNIEKRIIEELPEPVKAMVLEFFIHHYHCRNCNESFGAKHKALPENGRFGNNLVAQTALMKYEDRLPYRKLRSALKRQNGIEITPASILELANRAGNKARTEYGTILGRIRLSEVVYADETSIKVSGKTFWIWIFTSGKDTITVVRKSRGRAVPLEVLGHGFAGIVVCDGWRAYKMFGGRLQRCWAHLLREANHLSERIDEAKHLSNELHDLYLHVTTTLSSDPPPEKRALLRKEAEMKLLDIICKSYSSAEVQKFAGKVNNGLDSWFTFVENPNVEPTNNRAERGLREHVVHRKIIGTLRNEKGTFIHETLMSVIETWRNQGYNTHEKMLEVLRS